MAKRNADSIPTITVAGANYPLPPGTGPFEVPFPASGSYGAYFLPSSDAVPALIERWDVATKGKDEKELESEEWQALRAHYLKHLAWRFEYPRTVFGQQIATAWAITILVFLLVIAGIGFSVWQLLWAIRLGDLSSLNTEVAIETAGKLSMSSSIVGVIVLLVSLGFFYLFIRHVFGVRQPLPPHVSFRETDASLFEEKPRDAGDNKASET